MTTATAPQIARISAKSIWEGGTRATHRIRNLPSFVTDEPEEMGGGNAGPSPLEYVLAAFNGCLAVIIHQVAEEMDFDYDEAEFTAKGEVDIRGLQGVPGVRPYFKSIEHTVTLRSQESKENLDKLRETVVARCPMANLLVQAEIDVKAAWSLTR